MDSIPTNVTMAPVTSSQIKAIGHDAAANRLYVEFPVKKGRSVYSYENVTAAKHAALIGSDKKEGEEHSVGRHFGQHIKGNPTDHPYKRLNLEEGN